MHITNTVKIGGITYSVAKVPKPDAGNVEVDGQITYDEQTIHIRQGMPKEYTDIIFLHEIIHGIFNYMGVENKEGIVDQVTRGLYMVIKDNPEIFKEGD